MTTVAISHLYFNQFKKKTKLSTVELILSAKILYANCVEVYTLRTRRIKRKLQIYFLKCSKEVRNFKQ